MTERVLGNVFVRDGLLAEAGDRVIGHTHNFDHVTLVPRGALRIEARHPDGRTAVRERVAAGEGAGFVLIRKDWEHTLIALEPGTVYWCVYAHRQPQADGTVAVVQDYTGWDEAYC